MAQLRYRYLGPFNTWKTSTWDPFSDDLKREWAVQVTAGKNPNFDATVNQINADLDRILVRHVVVNLAVSDQSTTVVTGLVLALGGIMSGNAVLEFTGIGLMGGGAYTYLADQSWFQTWVDSTIKPHLDGPVKKITGYGLALFGIVGGNREWIKKA